MTAHQIAILTLSTLLFGMLWIRDFRRNRKDAMPMQGDDDYQSHTAFLLPSNKWKYIWSNFRNLSLQSWNNYLLCWVAINLYGIGGMTESSMIAICVLLIFHIKQVLIFEKAYRDFQNTKVSFLILSDGVCSVVHPSDLQDEDTDYNKSYQLKDYIITSFIPWSHVTHVHIYTDNVAVESKKILIQFFYEDKSTLNDILRAIAPRFKKTATQTIFLSLDEAKKQMQEDAGLAAYLLPYAPDSKERPPFTSQTGGRPNLPANIAWPCHLGRPMSCLAQIRISEMQDGSETETPESPLGEKGMLFFFADLKTQNRDDQESYKVIYLPDEPVVPERPYPDDLTASFRFDSIPIVLAPDLGFYDYMSYGYAEDGQTMTKATYDAVINLYFNDHNMDIGHMFGGAQWIEHSPITHIKELQTDNNYFLLLQLQGFADDEENLHPLQIGRPESLMFFYIKNEDLEKRDFTHVLVEWQ